MNGILKAKIINFYQSIVDIGIAPNLVIDVLSIRCNHVAGQNIFAFLFA